MTPQELQRVFSNPDAYRLTLAGGKALLEERNRRGEWKPFRREPISVDLQPPKED